MTEAIKTTLEGEVMAGGWVIKVREGYAVQGEVRVHVFQSLPTAQSFARTLHPASKSSKKS